MIPPVMNSNAMSAPLSRFQTDFYICGIAPFKTDHIILLAYREEVEDDEDDTEGRKSKDPVRAFVCRTCVSVDRSLVRCPVVRSCAL